MSPSSSHVVTEPESKLSFGWKKIPLPSSTGLPDNKTRLYFASDDLALASTAVVNAVKHKGRVLMQAIPKEGLQACIRNTPFLLKQGHTLSLIGIEEGEILYRRAIESSENQFEGADHNLSNDVLRALVKLESKFTKVLQQHQNNAGYTEDLSLSSGFFCQPNVEPKTALGMSLYKIAQNIPDLIQSVDFRAQIEKKLNTALMNTKITGQVSYQDIQAMTTAERKTVMSAVSNIIYTYINFRLYDPAPKLPSYLLKTAFILNAQLNRSVEGDKKFLVTFQDFFSRNRVEGSTTQSLKLSGSNSEAFLYQSLIEADALCKTAPLEVARVVRGLIENNVGMVESAVSNLYKYVVHELWNLFTASDSRAVEHRYNPLEAAKSMFSLGTTRDENILPVISGAHSMSVQFLDALFSRKKFNSEFGFLQKKTPIPDNYRELLNILTALNLPKVLRSARVFEDASQILDHAQREFMQIMTFHRSRMALVIMLAEKVGRKITSAGDHVENDSANKNTLPHHSIGNALVQSQSERTQPTMIAAHVRYTHQNQQTIGMSIHSKQLHGYYFVPGDHIRFHLLNSSETTQRLQKTFQQHRQAQVNYGQLPNSWRDCLKAHGCAAQQIAFFDLLPFLDVVRINFIEASKIIPFSVWSENIGGNLETLLPLINEKSPGEILTILRPIERTVTAVRHEKDSVNLFFKNNAGYLANLKQNKTYPIELLRSRLSPPPGSPVVFAMGTAASVAASFCKNKDNAMVFVSLKNNTDKQSVPEIEVGNGGQVIFNLSREHAQSQAFIQGHIDKAISKNANALKDKVVNGEKFYVFGSSAFEQTVRRSLESLLQPEDVSSKQKLKNALYFEGYSDVAQTIMSKRQQVLSNVFSLKQVVTSTNCLLTMNGLVFDLDQYKKRHWGGQELIDMLAKTEATQAYQCISVHDNAAESDLFNCLVGVTAPSYQAHPNYQIIQKLTLAKNIFNLDYALGDDQREDHAYYLLRSIDACRRAQDAIRSVLSADHVQKLGFDETITPPRPPYQTNQFGDLIAPSHADINSIAAYRQTYKVFIVSLFERCLSQLIDL